MGVSPAQKIFHGGPGQFLQPISLRAGERGPCCSVVHLRCREALAFWGLGEALSSLPHMNLGFGCRLWGFSSSRCRGRGVGLGLLPWTPVSRNPVKPPAACAMDPKVSNGSGIQDECITDLLVFGFLQNCSNYNFHKELQVLGHDLPVPVCLGESHDDELQTDGSRYSHFVLQSQETDSESQEEIIQNIARQLAQIGDRMDRSVPPRLVNHLAIQFMNGNLSEEDRRECLAAVLEQVMQTYPKDMEEEKTMLLLTMLLAKKEMD
ncbi:PREDICTED: LOW QUALITY PROTEIN: BH3-interacting domain death agonist [Miniopterus natalensis]|uniref:LOW QUALITY PROTEIN: BH3-interacting domain death agonist n=1 Tax=Miniopterus natalensis TaxID=291302 RepID=UPI0007A72359|nr:PREDICTED: LOW QUALITY PROTEIN: BH3-interacting domain death agonist [Miniopterus natalensis]